MYHPPNDLEAEEYVELYNSGNASVDLSGWGFTKGISYTFPKGTTIKPDSYLVICRSVDGFQAAYGKKIETLGDFAGTLSNGGERITLSDRAGNVVDTVKYDDRPPWPMGADGYSASLERICPSAEGKAPNWASSPLPTAKPRSAGTPGRRNACYSEKLPPAIPKVDFSPKNPRPDEAVTVQAKAVGESAVILLYRTIESGFVGEEAELPMRLGKAGQYEAVIPGQSHGSIVRFRIKATNSDSAVRFEPHENGLRPAYSYFTYANTESATIPIGMIITVNGKPRQSGQQRREARWSRNRSWGRPPRSLPPPRGKSAFIYISPDSGTYQIYDYINVLPRTGGYKVRFHKDQPLNGMTTINLIFEFMPRFALAEHLSYKLYQRAGVPSEYSEYVRLSVDDRLLGYHLLVEQPNRNFLRRNERDDTGNMYKLLWYNQGVVAQHEKKTNLHTGHDDIVEIIAALEKTKGMKQWELIQQHFNVDEFINYYAASMCLTDWDGFWNNYFTYHDINGTGKWEIYPWDKDKTWGYYDGVSSRDYLYDMPLTYGMDEKRSFWQRKPVRGGPNWGRMGKPPWWRPGGYFSGAMLANEHFRRLFLIRLKEIAETIYTEEIFFPIIDEMERTLEPEVRIRAAAHGRNVNTLVRRFHSSIKSLRKHLTERRNFILSQKEIRELTILNNQSAER